MSINEEFQTVFHGVSYILSISLKKNSSVLYIDVEQENTGDRWRGEFSAKYIEQITQKTGNFKRFVVFAKMLTVALGQKSETVFVDLLTYNDLEMLKSRKTGKGNNISVNASFGSNRSSSNNKKRYLILTYAVEFDRVHYPLPLAFEKEPDVESLKRTVQRLRKDIARKDKMMNGTAKKASTAANNNSNNIMMEDYEGDGNTTVIIAMREELDALRKQNKRLKNSSKTTTNAQYERLKEDSTLEIKRLRKECKSLQTQLNLVADDRDRMRGRSAAQSLNQRSNNDVSRQLKIVSKKLRNVEKALDSEKAQHNRTKQKAQKYANKAKAEVSRLKDQIKSMRIQIRDLKISNKRRAMVSRSPSNRSVRSVSSNRSRGRSSNINNRSRTSIRTSNSSIRSRSSFGSSASRSRSPNISTRSRRSNNTSGNVRKKRVVKKKPANTSTTTRRTRKTTRTRVNVSNNSNLSTGSRGSIRSNRSNRSTRSTNSVRNRRKPSPYNSGYSSAASQSSVESGKRTRIAKRKVRKKKKSTAKTTKRRITNTRSPSAERRKKEMLQRDRMTVPTNNSKRKANNKTKARPPLSSSSSISNINVPPAPQSKQPSIMKPPESPGLNDTSFDANTEMADIDRRLNALQDFLKEAKNGNINVEE